jgi:hypothetical protein
LKGEREYEVKRLIDCRLKGEARPDYILSPSMGKLRPSPPPSNTIYNVGASLYRLAAGRWDER